MTLCTSSLIVFLNSR